MLSLKSGRCPLKPWPMVLATEFRQEKESKGIQIRKEVKTINLQIIFYTENPNETTKELLQLINQFSKVAGEKISI